MSELVQSQSGVQSALESETGAGGSKGMLQAPPSPLGPGPSLKHPNSSPVPSSGPNEEIHAFERTVHVCAHHSEHLFTKLSQSGKEEGRISVLRYLGINGRLVCLLIFICATETSKRENKHHYISQHTVCAPPKQ